ncbi:hypothetical protein [Bradyrhizobium elkanii]|uniref:hypothetical protein n=1 Tax=Bradyrhizobium elkanii TaxID=29448 RepID=UPI003D193DA3
MSPSRLAWWGVAQTKKAGIYLLKGETYPYDTLVCLGVTREQIIEYIEKHFDYKLSEADLTNLTMKGVGRTGQLENNSFILWLKHFPVLPNDFGALAHETFHVADLMLRFSGLSLSNESDEAWAYHVDWLTRCIYEAFDLCSPAPRRR